MNFCKEIVILRKSKYSWHKNRKEKDPTVYKFFNNYTIKIIL